MELGNLVALPLQGNARKNGNSIFVNEKLSLSLTFPYMLPLLTKVQSGMAASIFSASTLLRIISSDSET